MNQKKPNRRRPQSKAPGGAPNTKAVREYTAGGVVWRRRDDEYQILMIQDHLGRWTIPKGHVEPGESLEQTALREVTEETGLGDLKLGEKLDKLHFFYRKDGKLIFMTTTVYLIAALGDTDKVMTEEDTPWIVDAKWFGAEDALRLVEYRDTERLFRLGLSRLQGNAQARPGGNPRRRRRRRRSAASKVTVQS